MKIAEIAGLYRKSPISPISGLKIADFRRLAIFRQGKIAIAKHRSKIADLAIYRQKWQHWASEIEDKAPPLCIFSELILSLISLLIPPNFSTAPLSSAKQAKIFGEGE